MACMSKIDFLSFCHAPDEKSQTRRMQSFLSTFVSETKVRENEVVVKMFRHGLMHTGALQFVFDAELNEIFTWRIHWNRPSADFKHFSITDEDPRHQGQMLGIHDVRFPSRPSPQVLCFNCVLTELAEDLVRGGDRFLDQGDSSEAARESIIKACREVSLQVL